MIRGTKNPSHLTVIRLDYRRHKRAPNRWYVSSVRSCMQLASVPNFLSRVPKFVSDLGGVHDEHKGTVLLSKQLICRKANRMNLSESKDDVFRRYYPYNSEGAYRMIFVKLDWAVHNSTLRYLLY